jgi:flagellar hook assembly protein FlgD
VQLEIFNVLGQRVRTLLHATREAGQHEILWNGANDAGERLAAGVYIMRLRAGKMTTARRVTLTR